MNSRNGSDVSKMASLYSGGKTLEEIGELLGCSYMTVRRALAKSGVEIRRVGVARKRCRFVVLGMARCGMSIAEIAETFGDNRSSVSKWLKSVGFNVGRGRTSGRPREKTCKVCGTAFVTTKHDRETCSDECSRRLKNRHSGGHYRKRAIKHGCEYDPSVTLKRLVERDGLTCYICGRECDPADRSWGSLGPTSPTLDHVVALANGGGHVWENVRVACAMCNTSKKDKAVFDPGGHTLAAPLGPPRAH